MIPENDKNFCRVFELPENYPPGFCFGGGKPVTFKMVDWFQPWPMNFKTFELEDIKWEEVEKRLVEFLKQKRYCVTGSKYLVITDFGESIIFEK